MRFHQYLRSSQIKNAASLELALSREERAEVEVLIKAVLPVQISHSPVGLVAYALQQGELLQTTSCQPVPFFQQKIKSL